MDELITFSEYIRAELGNVQRNLRGFATLRHVGTRNGNRAYTYATNVNNGRYVNADSPFHISTVSSSADNAYATICYCDWNSLVDFLYRLWRTIYTRKSLFNVVRNIQKGRYVHNCIFLFPLVLSIVSSLKSNVTFL